MKKTTVLFLFLFALGLVAGLSFLYSRLANDGGEAGSREVAAVVNGQRIYAEQIAWERTALTSEQNASISNEQVLGFLIQKTLLLQASKEEAVVATSEQIEALKQDMPELPFGRFSEDEINERLAEQAAINSLRDKITNKAFVIKNEDVLEVYETAYTGKNVSFDEVEQQIVDLLTEKHKAESWAAYVKSLHQSADVTVFSI